METYNLAHLKELRTEKIVERKGNVEEVVAFTHAKEALESTNETDVEFANEAHVTFANEAHVTFANEAHVTFANEELIANFANVNELIDEALDLEFANVVLGVEPWVHKTKKKWWSRIYNARPWVWPLVLIDVFVGGEIVQDVGPGLRPKSRHEWEKPHFF